MVQRCIVESCKAEWTPNSTLSFFRIKKDKATLEKWQKVIPRLREVKSYHTICSKHFAPECIHEMSGRKYLTKNAVPTIFDKENISTVNTADGPSKLRNALTSPKSIPVTVESNNVQLEQKRTFDATPLPVKEGPPEKQMHSVQVQTSVHGSSLTKPLEKLRKKIKMLQTRLRRQEKRIYRMQLNERSKPCPCSKTNDPAVSPENDLETI